MGMYRMIKTNNGRKDAISASDLNPSIKYARMSKMAVKL
jgi:hypothetical protein